MRVASAARLHRHERSGDVALLLLRQRAVIGRFRYRIQEKHTPAAATAGVAKQWPSPATTESRKRSCRGSTPAIAIADAAPDKTPVEGYRVVAIGIVGSDGA